MDTAGKEGNGMHQCEVSFSFNKYNRPELLGLRQSVANTICNAIFMVPGNNPSSPLAGVDIRQYFYKEESEISSDKIKQDLLNTCGDLPGGASIKNVDFSVQQTTEGQTVFLLIVRITIAQDDTLLGISMQQQSRGSDIVNFNFDYVDI